MTQPTPTNPLTKWISDNLLTIVLGAAVIYSGFASSDAVTNARLDQIDRRLETIQRGIDQGTQSSQCQIRNIEKLNDRTGVVSSCQM